MGGHAGDQKPKSQGRDKSSGLGEKATNDLCDLEFELDLVGLRAGISGGLAPGDELDVELGTMGSVTSVVCRSKNGMTVGAMAAFRGLAQLIKCPEAGVRYRALVVFASTTRCHVSVAR
jgi:hypothetical protein